MEGTGGKLLKRGETLSKAMEGDKWFYRRSLLRFEIGDGNLFGAGRSKQS